ncbi:hypothetical protein FRB95_001292 [Tulasnella sp. JGI-2019a]|nr:hypothetical protein FRB93_006488 [Tulasnella sp. JGI-2019a]KAG9038435.1 hypothetical protein FRB95_001292 [Tulasnella sp. JGI-2019a]
MAERKVLNKYFPPDFDPSKIPRRHLPKNAQQVVRLMAPFSMRCNTCGEYVYKGKKFNARKETVEGEDYHGIKIFRFYIKCTLCSAEITFKTDPKNTDYVAEHGASRNFEPWRDERAVEEDRIAKLEEEENNPMKALENKTTDSKREMDILDALQDIRSRNARHEKTGTALAKEGRLESIVLGEGDDEEDEEDRRLRLEAEEDERLVREVFSRVPSTMAAGPSTATPSTSTAVQPPTFAEGTTELTDGSDTLSTSVPSTAPLPTVTVKRKAAAQPDVDDFLSAKPAINKSVEPPAKRKKDLAASLGIKIVKKKPAVKSLV